MAKLQRNNIQSLVLDRFPTPHTAGTAHSTLWTTFSGATFRRKFFNAVSCGGSSRHRHHHAGGDDDGTIASAIRSVSEIVKEKRRPENSKSEKLLDLLKLELESSESENDIKVKKEKEKKKGEVLEEMKCAVKNLQDEDLDERRAAARRVRLFAKEDKEARVTLAMIGAIPPLIGMLDLEDDESKIASLYALLNLAIGNDTNKAAIVEAGGVHKMLNLIGSINSKNSSVSAAIVANFLGLSALDSNKLVIGSSGAIPFLVNNLYDFDNKTSSQAKQDALRALFNLSIFPSNVAFISETDLIPFLLNSLGDMEISERALSILSNVVSTREGRRAIGMVPDVFPILIDVLNWIDSPECQEKASYILMVMAHKSYTHRQAMIEAGIMSVLLELTLLGSTLAQKRASRMLECLRFDKGKVIRDHFGGNISAPISGSLSSSMNPNVDSIENLEDFEELMSEERKAVKQLVRQSLQNNMRRIVKRANLPQDFVPSDNFKTLTSSSTSKSLPF